MKEQNAKLYHLYSRSRFKMLPQKIIACRARTFFYLFSLTVTLLSVRPGFADDFPQYDIRATIDPSAKTISALQKVTFKNTSGSAIRDVYFHIYPNRKYSQAEKNFMLSYASYFKVNPYPEGFDSGEIQIKSIHDGKRELGFVIEGDDETLLKVNLTADLSPGESIEIDLDFNVRIPHAYGRLGYVDEVYALSRWYPILSVLNENGWVNHPFYPFHRPFFSEASIYSVELNLPSAYEVIHTGEEKSVSDQGSTKTYKIKTINPVREFTLAMSPNYKMIENQVNNVKIKSFYLPGDEFHARQALESASALMKFYSARFGDYPYSEFSIAPVYLGYGGEQMSNMIFIDTRVYQLPKFLMRYLDFLVAHETGHQWFYNLVGTDEFTNMWMEEGVNSYFLLDYLEDRYGKDAPIFELPKPLNWFIPTFSFRDARDTRYKIIARTSLDRPIVGKLSSFSEPSTIFSIAYGKGAGFVYMLKYVMGEDAFKRAFARIFKEYRFKNLSGEELIRICIEESGKDLAEFFRQWLETSGHLDYSVAGVSHNNIQIVNKGKIQMPVTVRVRYKDSTEEIFIWDGKDKTKNISVSKAIKQIAVDPQEELLDIDRTNNFWPRKIFVKPVPLHLPLYDLSIFLPEDSYTIVVGPEIANGVGLKMSLQKPYDQNFYVASDYDFGEKLHHSRVGYQLNNLFKSQTTAGIEIFNVNDLDGDEEDLAGGKLYLRKELWPASYGLGDVNDHITFYLIRNRTVGGGSLTGGGLEDIRNVSYLKKDEAIVGTALHFGRSGPYPDPKSGYEFNTLLENSGHFLGATQYFYRTQTDIYFYQPVTLRSKMAYRAKYGWGYPEDKNLFELGGINGLRGFDRKTIRGSEGFLGSVEYRFPLMDNLDIAFFDHLVGIESIGAVAFVDAGQAWYEDFGDSQLKKDAGGGLRVTFNIGSFLEKAILRLDVAQPIHEDDEDTHYWAGINHAF